MPRRVVKRKKRIGLTKLSLAIKGLITRSTSPRKLCRAVVCGGDFVVLFIGADHVDQKATCIVSYPAY